MAVIRKKLSEKERLIRLQAKEVRDLKNWCIEHDTKCYTYDQAGPYYMCVTSRSDYDVHDMRKDIAEDNHSYFLTPEDYEKWCEDPDF